MPRSSYIYTVRVITGSLLFFCALFSYNAGSVHHREGVASRSAQVTQRPTHSLIWEEIEILSDVDNATTQDDPSPAKSGDLVIDEFSIA